MYDEKKGQGHFGFRLSTGLKADGLALPRRSASASPPNRIAAGASLRRGGLGPSGFAEASLGATGGRRGPSRSLGRVHKGFAGRILGFAAPSGGGRIWWGGGFFVYLRKNFLDGREKSHRKQFSDIGGNGLLLGGADCVAVCEPACVFAGAWHGGAGLEHDGAESVAVVECGGAGCGHGHRLCVVSAAAG